MMKVKVGNDQEMAQTERKSLSKNRGGETKETEVGKLYLQLAEYFFRMLLR